MPGIADFFMKFVLYTLVDATTSVRRVSSADMVSTVRQIVYEIGLHMLKPMPDKTVSVSGFRERSPSREIRIIRLVWSWTSFPLTESGDSHIPTSRGADVAH